MGLKIKLGGATVVLAAAALAVTPMAASAANATALVFQGKTTVLTSGFGYNAVPWVGGGGSYGFDSTGTTVGCHELIEVEGLSADAINQLCTITVTSGSYTNIVCGTGSTGGGILSKGDTASVTDGTEGGESSTITYGINFVAGTGVILGNESEPDGGSGTVVGIVNIAPANAGSVDAPDRSLPGDGPCVTQFLATGIALSAGASS